MLRSSLLLLALTAVIAVAARGEPDLYPVLEAGIVKLTVRTAPHSITEYDTTSIGIVQLNAPGGGEALLVCAPDAGPGLTVGFVGVVARNPGDGSAARLKARAYPALGCTGDLTSDSDNSAFVRFAGPGSPTIIDVAPEDADVIVP